MMLGLKTASDSKISQGVVDTVIQLIFARCRQFDSIQLAIRQIELTMHRAMLKLITATLSLQPKWAQKYKFWSKNDGEKWSKKIFLKFLYVGTFFYFKSARNHKFSIKNNYLLACRDFKINFSKPLFTIIFRPKMVFSDTDSILRVKSMYESVK